MAQGIPTPSTPADLAAAVREEIEKLRPAVQADGGDIEFAEMVDGVVRVRLLGACTTCPSSVLTLKAGVEARLMEVIPSVRRVETVQSQEH